MKPVTNVSQYQVGNYYLYQSKPYIGVWKVLVLDQSELHWQVWDKSGKIVSPCTSSLKAEQHYLNEGRADVFEISETQAKALIALLATNS